MKALATTLLVLLSVLVAESSIAQQGINAPPDTIFYNGKIITVDSGFTVQQAFAVRGEQYVAVGTTAAIRALAGANTRLVDLRGSAVIPGLSDNHDHLYNSAKVMRGIDLVGATSTAPMPSPAKSTIRDRHTIFCGVLRSFTSFSSRSRSSGGTWMRSILPIQADSHPYADLGIL